MEATAMPEDGGAGEAAAGEGREALSLGGFSYASPHGLLRSDASPFRAAASSCHGAAAAAGASFSAPTSDGGAAEPHPSRRTWASPPNGGVGGGGVGGTACSGHGAVSDTDSYGAPSSLRRSVNSAGLGTAGDATFQLLSPFTATQWRELHRQALIFKCIATSAPVPPDLLTHSPFAGAGGHRFFSDMSRGAGDYLNLRFTGATGEPEPGRCRRTDGKKWRCSRDVTPGQKYCERHVHRARPRSRKPVEVLDGKGPDPAAAAAANTAADTGSRRPPVTSTKSETPGPSAGSPPWLPATDLKFPFQFMVPDGKKLRCSVDAWPRSENPFDGVVGDGSDRSLENLPPSTLTLSMSGTGDGGGERHDQFQVGIRATESEEKMPAAPGWMFPVSPPIGGPLAEVLQKPSSAASFGDGRAGHQNYDAAASGGGGLIDLMCCCDGEATSPTPVLQKAFVSLSDVGSGHTGSSSNRTFGIVPAGIAELGLKWAGPFD